ncbi:MAG: hypothetical protein JSR71_13250 [Proteobacteria bacterium]|nr:hypothetical protein [Pseudomonadota bacterium]
MAVEQMVENVRLKEDFINFIQELSNDFKKNINSWENRSVDSYLEAVADWVEGMDNYYINMNKPVPQNINWKVLADIFMAAKMYE